MSSLGHHYATTMSSLGHHYVVSSQMSPLSPCDRYVSLGHHYVITRSSPCHHYVITTSSLRHHYVITSNISKISADPGRRQGGARQGREVVTTPTPTPTPTPTITTTTTRTRTTTTTTTTTFRGMVFSAREEVIFSKLFYCRTRRQQKLSKNVVFLEFQTTR